MKALAKLTLIVLLCHLIGGAVLSCTSDDYQVATNTIEENGTKTFPLVFNGTVRGYDDQSTRSGAEAKGWTDGSSVFIKFMIDDTNFVTGVAEYKAKPNTWNITFKGDLPESTNGRCSVFYFDSIASVSGDSLVNLSKHHGAYMTESASYNFNGIEISIKANLMPMNGRIRFLGDSIESVKILGITSLSAFNAKTFEFTYDSTEVITSCDYSSNNPSFYYTDYIYGKFTDSIKPSLYMESKNGTFRRSCATVLMKNGSSGVMKCPKEDDYYGWVWFTGAETAIFSDAVDLGLSVLWSKRNLGAEYEHDSGLRVSWGDADGTNTSTSSDYLASNFTFSGNDTYDMATKRFGEQWRTPTYSQWLELYNKCDWKWQSKNGVVGYEVVAINGNKLFLPASLINSSGDPLGVYWSGDTNSSYYWEGKTFKFTKTHIYANHLSEKKYEKYYIRPIKLK